VSQDPSVDDLWDVSLEDVKVGAANGDRIHFDDRVGLIHNFRIRDGRPLLVANARVDECMHDRCPFSERVRVSLFS
jgi:hypothetical protein